MPTRDDIKRIAEAIGDDEYMPNAEADMNTQIPGFDADEEMALPMPEPPGMEDMPGAVGEECPSVAIDQDLLSELLKMVKSKGFEKGESGCMEPEGEEEGEEEGPPPEITGEDEDDEDDEAEEVGESKEAGKTVSEGEEGDEEGDEEDDEEGDEPDIDGESIEDAGEKGTEASDEDVEDVEEASEEVMDYTDCEEMAEKLCELGQEKGTLTINDLDEIKACCFPEEEVTGEVEEIENGGGEESEALDDIGDEPDEPDESDEVDEVDVEEAINPGMKPVSEMNNSNKPWEKNRKKRKKKVNEALDIPATAEGLSDELDERVYAEIGKPGTEIDEGTAQKIFEMYKEAGLNDLDSPVVRTAEGKYMIEDRGNIGSARLAESVIAFVKEAIDTDINIRKSKSEAGVEFMGDEDNFVKIHEAINTQLEVLREGKSKYDMGAMSKYSRCYPVRGAGRLYYVFK